MRRTKAGVAVVRLHYTADPSKSSRDWVAEERKKYSSEAWWRMEMEIEYDALSGQRVYPEFDPEVHVVPDDMVPKSGCRYMSIDPHPRTPHAFLWVLIDAFSDWWVYRDLWPSVVYGQPQNLKDTQEENVFTIRDYAETLAVLEGNSLEWRKPTTDDEYAIYRRRPGGELIVDRFMDQASKGFLASGDGQVQESYSTRYDRFGIQCRDPYKIHKSGEDAIRDLLKLRRHDRFGLWPRLHIAASCEELQVEFLKHKYKVSRSSSNENELRQEGVDARSHQLDNLRYLATSGASYIAALVS